MNSVNAQKRIFFSSFLYENRAVWTGAGNLQKRISLKTKQCERSLRRACPFVGVIVVYLWRGLRCEVTIYCHIAPYCILYIFNFAFSRCLVFCQMTSLMTIMEDYLNWRGKYIGAAVLHMAILILFENEMTSWWKALTADIWRPMSSHVIDNCYRLFLFLVYSFKSYKQRGFENEFVWHVSGYFTSPSYKPSSY